MRTALALAFLLFTAAIAIARDPIKGLSQGMDYAKARRIVLQQGWQADVSNPMHKDELQASLQKFFIDSGYTEVETCLPTGLGTCMAAFHNAEGRRLYLFTGSPFEDHAIVTSWCIGSRDPNCRRPSR